jgi:SAM-dependent methyltransferase
VLADYQARADQWRTIYDSPTFHDRLIAERLEMAIELIEQFGPGKGRALDLGCGAGQAMVRLGQLGYQLDGCDLAPAMVEASQAALAASGVSGHVQVATAENLPYHEARFDIVVALGLIEYLERPEVGLAEIRRVLRPGGRAVITAPNPLRLAYMIDPVQVVQGVVSSPRGGYRRSYFRPSAFRRALRSAGFTVESIRGHGFGPITLASRPLVSDDRSLAASDWVSSRLPWMHWLGSDLVALVRR